MPPTNAPSPNASTPGSDEEICAICYSRFDMPVAHAQLMLEDLECSVCHKRTHSACMQQWILRTLSRERRNGDPIRVTCVNCRHVLTTQRAIPESLGEQVHWTFEDPDPEKFLVYTFTFMTAEYASGFGAPNDPMVLDMFYKMLLCPPTKRCWLITVENGEGWLQARNVLYRDPDWRPDEMHIPTSPPSPSPSEDAALNLIVRDDFPVRPNYVVFETLRVRGRVVRGMRRWYHIDANLLRLTRRHQLYPRMLSQLAPLVRTNPLNLTAWVNILYAPDANIRRAGFSCHVRGTNPTLPCTDLTLEEIQEVLGGD